ncbi:MAG: hypothetical protein V1662_05565 [Candidatus Omnitrophota bacterium]
MRRILGFLFAALLVMAPVAYAQDYNPMYDFYKGLADVIENNIANSEECVAASETFIKANIGTLQASIEQAQKLSVAQAQVNAESAQTAMESLTDEQKADMAKGMDALDRFMQVFNTFSRQYPDEAEKIAGFISQYAPQPAAMSEEQMQQQLHNQATEQPQGDQQEQ